MKSSKTSELANVTDHWGKSLKRLLKIVWNLQNFIIFVFLSVPSIRSPMFTWILLVMPNNPYLAQRSSATLSVSFMVRIECSFWLGIGLILTRIWQWLVGLLVRNNDHFGLNLQKILNEATIYLLLISRGEKWSSKIMSNTTWNVHWSATMALTRFYSFRGQNVRHFKALTAGKFEAKTSSISWS